METPPDISICILNWNGREMLRGLLSSIREHREPLNVEAIVVDNASADDSAKMVQNDFTWIKLIKNTDNLGFARGNNIGAKAATAPLIFFLNNDTLLKSGTLQKLAETMDRDPSIVAAGPKLIGTDGKAQLPGRNLPTVAALMHRILILRWTRIFKAAYQRYRRSGFDPDKSGPVEQLAAAALIVRRDAFEKVGGFDERYPFGMEDVDLCARLGELGKIYYQADAEVVHLGRVSSRANSPFVYRGYECGYARFISKRAGTEIRVLYKLLVTVDMPVRILALAAQYIASLFKGKEAREKAGASLSAAAKFLCCGLTQFWQT